MTDRQLYFISGSPPCWSVMLALEVKGLAYTPKRLDNAKREQKASKFRAIRKTSVFGSKAAVHRNGPADAH